MVVKFNGFITFFSHLFVIFPDSSASQQGAILVRIARLMAQMSHDLYTCFWGFGASNSLWRTLRSKNRQIWNRKSQDLTDFLQKIVLALEPLRVNYTLKHQDSPIKVTFLMENYKQKIHFSWWWFNRKCTFKMAAADILDIEKLLPFFHYLTHRHQN